MNLAELQKRFDQWETPARGHLLWPHRVGLEPPYVPFLSEQRVRGEIIDDGRKASIWSRWLKRSGVKPPAAEARPVPAEQPRTGPVEIIELQILVPKDFAPRPDVTRRCLEALAASGARLSFEIVGKATETVIQFACEARQRTRVLSVLRAFFPETRVRPRGNDLLAAWSAAEGWCAIVNLGLRERVFRRLRVEDRSEADPFIDVIGRLASIEPSELGVVQVLMEPARGRWAEDFITFIRNIDDADRVLPLVEHKFSERLYGVALRVAGLGATQERAGQMALDLAQALTVATWSAENELIPTEPADESFESALSDLLDRETRRSGMLLSLSEVSTIAHLPSAVIRSESLLRQATRTRAAPAIADATNVILGANEHEGEARRVGLSVEGRLRHTYCIGASGTGKSTLLLSMIDQDIASGHGFGVLDPHGDLIDDVLSRIPADRAGDVVLFDPSDEDFPVGFNVLSAHSELERTLLASDLVGVFKRFSSTFGDQMATVLGNAVLAFLESSEGGTLLDLRDFLVDKPFRERFLRTVQDDEVRLYWTREFSLLKGMPQGSILTRLNTFLRPKTIRYMVAQRRDNLDLRAIMDNRRIFLARLSHGAIGEENAYLLGSLLVARLAQAAMSRQDEDAGARVPFFLYMDEFQHFITPSIATILSGARKYGLGLILSHQEIRQLKSRSDDTLSAVLGNAFTRIVFRVGEHDAKTLADGFSHFDARDLQNLGLGEAIVRIERPDYDFNLKTIRPSDVEPALAKGRRAAARALSRDRYASPRADIDADLKTRLKVSIASGGVEADLPRKPKRGAAGESIGSERADSDSESQADAAPMPGRGGYQHKKLQDLVRKLAEERGFAVRTEVPVLEGHGHVDAILEGDGRRIGVEISVSSRLEREVGNITKCLAAGVDYALLISPDARLLDAAKPELANVEGRVRFLTPGAVATFLDELSTQPAKPPKLRQTRHPAAPKPGSSVLSAQQAAETLGIATQTLAKMRWSGDSPPFMKIGRKVVYSRDELEEWLKERRRRSTSDPG